ncbi:FKBP-type peptidyl-prolyl cis-trans isomerase [Salibacter sp.]|uniref:FKBP-type peptidyl-prolyl cis-trans isomerase n=1 Tax=Salibacter sp. TaxID=2010995 RepID=UPI00286FFBC3|nr:FKBP-type peptidyl-prolyl cis-trans isomerase [Salibacter sp.]MDR9488048.1 FKBP-type peptidyl-prolyl cis-trans isomerase [Salibacter sp.]
MEGSSITASGLEYKIHSFSDSRDSAQDNQWIGIRFKAETLNGKVIQNPDSMTVIPYQTYVDTGIMEALSLLYLGDSASFVMPGRRLRPLDISSKASKVKLTLSFKEIFSPEEYQFSKLYPGVLQLIPDSNQQRFISMVRSRSIADYSSISGIHAFWLKENKQAKRAIAGKRVVVDYEGFTTGEKLFDSTVKRSEPFDFELGQQGQVLRGIEILLQQMREGEEVLAVIPPELAFQNGSSDGTIPPNTVVMYNVKLRKVIDDETADATTSL